jgi:long-chain fatty acid transport protein
MRFRNAALCGVSFVALAAVIEPAVLIQPAHAGSFYLQEQSVRGTGRAHAGNTAIADDASTVYYNPAGMTELGRFSFDTGVEGIFIDVKTRNNGSTVRSPGTGGLTIPTTGNDGGNPADPAALPHFSMAVNLVPDRLWVGLTVNSSYGLITDYEGGWFGRYDSTHSELKTYTAQPTVAVKLNNWASIGIGAEIRYTKARLEAAIPNPFTAGGPRQATDGNFSLKGHDTAGSFNVGLLLKPSPQTNIGFQWRKQMNSTLRGSAYTTALVTPPAVPVGGVLVPLPSFNSVRSATADLTTPDTLSAGVAHKLNPNLTLLADVRWSHWKVFDEIRILDLSNNVVSVLPQNYKNVWTVAAGGEYRLNDKITLRSGVQYDQTPTVAADRSTRVPDGDRWWLSAGASYDWNQNLSFDIAYSHVFVKKIDVAATREYFTGTPFLTSTVTRGSVEPNLNIVSVGARYKF